MKALTCEMCGSTNLLKQDGVFVCQSCGTKYSVEEAKKMMVEGTVDVKGTVKVDRSGNVENLLKMAQNALGSVNGDEAYLYANKALEIAPENADAWFIKMKAVGLTAILKDLKVNDVLSAGKNVITFNPDKAKEVYTFYLTKMLSDLKFCMKHMADTDSIKRIYDTNVRLDIFKATENTVKSDKICNIILRQAKLVVYLRYAVPDSVVSSDTEIARLVGECSKQWIYYTNSINDRFNVYGMKLSDDAVAEYRSILNKIKEGLPEEKKNETQNESISNPSSSGCYVATAVYGSYDCPEVWTLRRFRDNTLAETWYGRAFIHTYYAISPTLVKWFGHTEWFKKMWKEPLDSLVRKLQSQGVENTPYNDRIW